MVRWVRAAVLSLLVVSSTLAAHIAGGGTLPDPSMLVPLCALVTLSSAALLRRPLSWWWSAAMLLAGQAALHGALQLLPGHAGRAGPAGPAVPTGMPGHLAGGDGVHLRTDPGVAALRALTEWSADARMLAAHLGAALLVGAWLAAGERALWSLARLAAGTMATAWLRVRHALSAAFATPFVLARPRCLTVCAVAVPLAIDPAGSGNRRRGPPTGGFVRSP